MSTDTICNGKDFKEEEKVKERCLAHLQKGIHSSKCLVRCLQHLETDVDRLEVVRCWSGDKLKLGICNGVVLTLVLPLLQDESNRILCVRSLARTIDLYSLSYEDCLTCMDLFKLKKSKDEFVKLMVDFRCLTGKLTPLDKVVILGRCHYSSMTQRTMASLGTFACPRSTLLSTKMYGPIFHF